MRTKVKFRLIGILAALFLALIGINGFLLFNKRTAWAEQTFLKETPALQVHYVVGERFIVPDATLVIGGTDYEAQKSVQYPDGRVYRSGIVTLNQAGKYTLKYTAEVAGKYYSESVEFFVKEDVVSFSGDGSSVSIDDQTGWANISLAPSATVRYNNLIDLSDNTKDDELASLFVTASETLKRDCEEYIIVLTDAYDESNQLFIRVKAAINLDTNPESPEYYTVYQAYVGVDTADRNQFVGREGSKVHRGDPYGTPIHQTFCNVNKVDAITLESQALSLRWDNAEKAFYVVSPGFYGAPMMVADLNNTDHFPKVWGGFSRNLVYFSLYAKDATGNVGFTVKHLDGEPVQLGTVEDTTAPTIAVNYGEYGESTLPNAVVGQPYRVFSAVADDLNLLNDAVRCKVYYNYTSNNARLINVTNGGFVPEYKGTYALVYSAEDDFGNVGEKVVYVNAIEASTLDFSVVGGSATAGVISEIAIPQIQTIDENTGSYALTVKATSGDISDVVYQGAVVPDEAVNYRFMATGDWTMTYILSDYSRAVEKTATYTVTAGQSIISDNFDDLTIDSYLISGNRYVLPQVNVLTFAANGDATYSPAKVKAVYGVGQEQEIENNLFTPDSATMGSEVTLVYYDEGDTSVSISGTRPVYDMGDNGTLDLTKLFLATNATVTAQNRNLSFTAEQDAQIKLLNKQAVNNFSINFDVDETAANFGKFSIILTDSVDESVAVKFTFVNLFNAEGDSVNGNTVVYMNDNSLAFWKLVADFGGVNNRVFNLSYDGTMKKVTLEMNTIEITRCLNGQPFVGFPSGVTYIDFEMTDVRGVSTVELTTINGQALSNYATDKGRPIIVTNGEYAATYERDEVIETITAIGVDVISGYSAATITVVSPSGETLMDNLDATISHALTLSEFGEYTIRYNATDRFGNKATVKLCKVQIEDNEKPNIQAKEEIKKFALLGDKFLLPEVEITDNSGQTLAMYVVIVKPNGVYQKVDPANYTFTMKGTYAVTLISIDAGGNMGRLTYYVEVI